MGPRKRTFAQMTTPIDVELALAIEDVRRERMRVAEEGGLLVTRLPPGLVCSARLA